MMSEYHGHATMSDGSHVALTPDMARALWEAAEQAEEHAAREMPDTATALSALLRARERLKRLGWCDGIYCPKDGSQFAFIEYGSTGIFAGRYVGEWPTGSIDNGDGSQRPEGVMWKAIDALSEPERTKMDECAADCAAWLDRMGQRLSGE